MNISQQILQFVKRNVNIPDLKEQDDIFANAAVNSLFALQLVMFLEHEFKIKIDDKDLELDNFRSVFAMENLITKKREAEKLVS